MFAPAVLPIQITFLILLVIAFGLPLLLRRFTKNAIPIGCVVCLLGSLPLLFAVGAIVDSIRYGEFQFETAGQSSDDYVELPSDATEITLHKYASGHEVKFKISRVKLEEWLTDITERRLVYADATPFELRESGDKMGFKNRFEYHNRKWSDETIKFEGWRSARGSGFDVWFCPKTKFAYVSDSYW